MPSNSPRDSADSLLSIINDILDFSKLDARKMTLEKIEFGPRQALEHTVKTTALSAHEKALEITVRVGSDVPATVIARVIAQEGVNQTRTPRPRL